MFPLKYILVVATLISVAVTTPLRNETNVKSGCIITNFAQVSEVVKSCNNIVIQNLAVPAGKTLELDLKTGTVLTFRGTTTFVYGAPWEGFLVVVKGDRITVNGEAGSKLDGQGAHYWDGKGDGGRKKPRFINILATQSTFSNINLLNCPHQCVAIHSSKLVTLTGWNIDVSAGDRNNLAHNTDGFGLGNSDSITIKNSVVKNQDDCVVVASGTNYHFENIQCSGSHGLSFSVGLSKVAGPSNQASNITFAHCTVRNSRQAIHIKMHPDGGKGFIKDVTYTDIKMEGITHFGVNVEQNYGSTGKPGTNIPITGLTLNRVTGTMTSGMAMPVYILCGSGACSNFKWSGVSITGGHKKSECNFHPSGYNC